jgi:hypothetical protein
MFRNGLSLPRSDLFLSKAPAAGSKIPAYPFNLLTNRWLARSAFGLPSPSPGFPGSGADHRPRPVARCSIRQPQPFLVPSLHFGVFRPLRLVALGSIQSQRAYFSRLPDHPSLPARARFLCLALAAQRLVSDVSHLPRSWDSPLRSFASRAGTSVLPPMFPHMSFLPRLEWT